jgi:uncharacterized protein (DUF2147 family)
MALKYCISTLLLMQMTAAVYAQDSFCKIWYTDGKKSKVRICKEADGKYYVQLIWMQDSMKNGKPVLDTENPDEKLRNRKWLGIKITNGLTKASNNELVDGKIYDPSKGNHYNCKMKLVSDKILELRGYILGLPFLGRTTRWTLAE